MPGTVVHVFVSPKADGVDTTLVQPSDWNDEHKFVGGWDGALLVYDPTPSDKVSWKNVVRPQLVSTVGLIVKGLASQTGNLLELQDSAAAVKVSFSPAGNFVTVGTATATGQIESLAKLVGPEALLSGANPRLRLTDTDVPGRSLDVKTVGNLAYLQDSAGADASLVTLDLLNTRVGFFGAPTVPFEVFGNAKFGGTMNLSAWASQSLGTNGYAKVGGLLFQWGVVATGVEGDYPVTFPTAFTTVYTVFVTKEDPAATPNNWDTWAETREITTTGFKARINWTQVGSNVNDSGQVHWLAIGV